MRSAPLLIAATLVIGAAHAAAQDDDAVPVFKEKGEASFYGPGFHGKDTASGEPFDQNDLTAAHPELPLGSKATVTNPETGKEVEVEINDRGPYAGGRSIDLSEAAAKEIGVIEEGVADVEIEVTKEQAEEAIDRPAEVPKVEKQLKDARKEAASDGTPQPKVPVDLDPPQDEVATGQ